MIKVFLVEDDPTVAQFHRQFIDSLEGFRVVGEARDGVSALDLMRRHEPDLVILDIFMPRRDGISVLKEIRRVGIAADAIVISAADDAKTVIEAQRFGAMDYILKPFRFERLKVSLEKYQATRGSLERATVSQEVVDTVWSSPRSESLLQKGLSELTLGKIVDAMRSEPAKWLSAEELAHMSGMSRITCRKYLEHMADAGIADVDALYGTGGRPKNLFRLKV